MYSSYEFEPPPDYTLQQFAKWCCVMYVNQLTTHLSTLTSLWCAIPTIGLAEQHHIHCQMWFQSSEVQFHNNHFINQCNSARQNIGFICTLFLLYHSTTQQVPCCCDLWLVVFQWTCLFLLVLCRSSCCLTWLQTTALKRAGSLSAQDRYMAPRSMSEQTRALAVKFLCNWRHYPVKVYIAERGVNEIHEYREWTIWKTVSLKRIMPTGQSVFLRK